MVQSYAKDKNFVSRDEVGMKRVRIKDPVKCRIELHLLVKKFCFPRKVLEDAHAAILLLDATKTWAENEKIVDESLKTLKRDETGCCYRLYSYAY